MSDRPPSAKRAPGHGRLSAALRAPGADVPPATTAGAPGQYRLRAVPPAPDHRSSARHQRAPGHGRPLAALRAARHDRPCATPRAPGADVPLATAAGAPGQYCLSAVPCRPRRTTTGPTPGTKGRRVMADPSPRHPTWRGMTVRAPPPGHRVLMYPRPLRLGRRVSIVCVPWRTPPSPCRPASAGCARKACPASLPIPAPSPTRAPTETLPTPAPSIPELSRPPAQRGDYRGAR